MAYIEIISIN